MIKTLLFIVIGGAVAYLGNEVCAFFTIGGTLCVIGVARLIAASATMREFMEWLGK